MYVTKQDLALIATCAAMSNLSRCLRDAGALCAAYGIGKWSAMHDATTGEWFTWRPGCGRPVQMLEAK